MGLAGAYRQPLEARFRTTARAGSDLTSLNVAGSSSRPFGQLQPALYYARCASSRLVRAVTFTGSLLVALGVPPLHAAARQRTRFLSLLITGMPFLTKEVHQARRTDGRAKE